MFYTVKRKGTLITHYLLRRHCFMELNFLSRFVKSNFSSHNVPLSIKVKLIENCIVENRYFEKKITINRFFMKLHYQPLVKL